jgi:glucose-1-phosphatase
MTSPNADDEPLPRRRVLLFDLGGVLIDNAMFASLQQLMRSDLSEAELIHLWLANPVAREYELGRCSTEVFCRSIVTELDLAISPEAFLTAFRGWPKGFHRGVDVLLAALRRHHTVCCLSNSNEAHWTDTITGHFDHAFSSHLIGHIKPDRSAFEYVVAALDVKPGDVHFFDDALANVEAATAFGLDAHHTVGYRSLRSKLTELGFVS